MTRVVIDASAAAALILEEDATAAVRQLWADPEIQFHAPAILVTEVFAAVHSAKVAGRTTGSADEQALLNAVRRTVTRRVVDDSLAEAAVTLLDSTGPCRAMDLLYLAVAVELGGLPLLSYDRRQRTAAEALGLPVLPAEV